MQRSTAPALIFLGLMGTNLSDAHLAAIERLRPDVVLEALDGDKFTNLNVAEGARAEMHEKLLGSEGWSDRRRRS